VRRGAPLSAILTLLRNHAKGYHESNNGKPKTDHGIVKDRHVQIATAGALIGSIIKYGISKHMVIVSDGAGQFNVLLHALCWIHANRAIDKIMAFTDQVKRDLDTVKDQVWLLYDGLKNYKQDPKLKNKTCLEKMFDQILPTKLPAPL
jgi:hypothetical protein